MAWVSYSEGEKAGKYGPPKEKKMSGKEKE